MAYFCIVAQLDIVLSLIKIKSDVIPSNESRLRGIKFSGRKEKHNKQMQFLPPN